MKIICIGRNYEDHIAELKNERPEEPVVFLKPDTALLRNNNPFYLPPFSNNLHHEVELVVKFDRLGKNIDRHFARRYYTSIGLGIDFTARDLQDRLRGKGLPWEKSKAFDQSAAISRDFIPTEELGNLNQIPFRLDINGETRQQGSSAGMLFSFDELVEQVSRYFTIKQGDLMYTGTPAGVGPVSIGDRLQGYIGDRLMFDFWIK